MGTYVSCYSKIEPAIRAYQAHVQANFGARYKEVVKKQFSYFEKKYYSDSENPEYIGSVRKFCYLYKYSVAHGYFLYRLLKRINGKVKPQLFDRPTTKVACIGGGPGSEIIGICRFLNEIGGPVSKKRVEITVFDREDSWEKSCELITDCVSKGLNVTFKFVTFDATEPSTYQDIDFSKFSHVISCFFMSELRKSNYPNKTKLFWKYLFKSLGRKRVFIAIDYRDSSGLALNYLNSVIPPKRNALYEDDYFDESCPDSKESIIDIEADLDHRPKKNGKNFVRAFITE